MHADALGVGVDYHGALREDMAGSGGPIAAARLQSLIDSRDASRDIAELRFQLGKIGEAVKSTVPQEMWAAIVEKLEELEQNPEALDVEADSFDDSYDDPYDPTEFIDDDEEF